MTATPDHRDRTGPPPDDDPRYQFVDLRGYDVPRDEQGQVVVEPDPDDDVELGGDDPPARPRTRRPAAARRKPAPRTSTSKTRTRSRRGRHRTEAGIGSILCMIALGYAAYWLTRELGGYPRDVCLIAAGLAAGLSTWSGRGWTALRRYLSHVIAPKGAGR
jgi:hypothetical protein